MSDLTDTLRKAAKDIADQGHFGWGNSSSDAADRIDHLERVIAQAREAFIDGDMNMVYAAIAAIDEALGKEKPSE